MVLFLFFHSFLELHGSILIYWICVCVCVFGLINLCSSIKLWEDRDRINPHEERRPADRDGRRVGMDVDNGGVRGNRGIIKFYVARVPEKCSSKEVSEALAVFGSIDGVYIARKRDKQGYRFEFTSFKGVKDPAEMEKKMKNVWMGSCRLFINVVRFSVENEESKENGGSLDGRGKEKMKKQEHKDRKTTYDHRFTTFVSNANTYAGTVARTQ